MYFFTVVHFVLQAGPRTLPHNSLPSPVQRDDREGTPPDEGCLLVKSGWSGLASSFSVDPAGAEGGFHGRF
jgi:hypothetical protein